MTPYRPLVHHYPQIKSPQPSIRSPHPLPRPSHTPLPLPSDVDEPRRQHTTQQCELLARLEEPVHRAAEAGAIFSGAQEEQVEEDAVPACEQEEEESVQPASGREV